MANPLTDVLTPEIRKAVYFVYASAGLIVGGIQVAYGSVNEITPDWLKITLAVYAFIGTAIGATAASNVSPPPPPG